MLERLKKKILPPHLELGRQGERLAERYLHGKGWRIIERNYATNAGEIDLIADDHGTLVFVEVRTRDGDQFGAAGQSVDRAKEKRIERAAEEYLRNWRCPDLPTRFDLVTLDFPASGAEKMENRSPVIRHIPAAF